MNDPRAKAADACTRVLGLCDALADIAADGFDVFAADQRYWASFWPVSRP